MRKLIVFIILSIFFVNLNAQNTIVGHVSDVNKEPVIGATVMAIDVPRDNVSAQIHASNLGTITDLEGRFSIELPADVSYLQISFMGYETQEIKVVSEQTHYHVVLEASAIALEDIVVSVGYGVQRKESVVGAISQASGETLNDMRGDLSLTNAMAGVVPGLSIIQQSGEPGMSAGDILIRGKSSWNSNNPLVLIDGIERSFDDVDPNDVQNISVLKDASATAVFGVKGANGVILITTKKGNVGKTKIAFSANLSLKQPNTTFDLLDHPSTMELYNQALAHDGVYDPSRYYSSDLIEKYRSGFDPYHYPEVDWFDEITRSVAVLQKYNINLSGGNDVVKYYASLSYANDGDIFKSEQQEYYDPSFSYSRVNLTSNVDVKLTRSTDLKVQVLGIFADKGQSLTSANDLMREATSKAPRYIFPVRYENGEIGDYLTSGASSNPYVLLNYVGASQARTNKVFSDLVLNQELDFITEGLSFNAKLSYNTAFSYSSSVNNKINDQINVLRYYYEPLPDGQYKQTIYPGSDYVERLPSVNDERMDTFMRDLYYEFSLRYNRSFGKHRVGALALFQRRKDFSGNKFRLPTEDWAGRIEYMYGSRYLLELSGAYNGSDRFAPGKRFGFFPAAAVGWIVSNEKFMLDNVAWMDKLKIRYSYGEVGSDIGAARWSYITQYMTNGKVCFGDNTPKSKDVISESFIGNTNATWETTRKHNLGLEFRFFEQLEVTLDLFAEKRDGMLMQRITIPSWFGAAAPYANIGKTKSHGYELMVNYTSPQWNGWSFNIGGNLSFAENRIVHRDDPANRDEYLQQAGKPIGSESMLVADGIYQDWDDVYMYAPSDWEQVDRRPGDVVYLDYNADGQITTLDKIPYGGLEYPKYNYGINGLVQYRNLSLDFLFTGAAGVSRKLNENMLFAFTASDALTAHPDNLDAWSENNKGLTMPANRTTGMTHNYGSGAGYMNSLMYQEADYIRLKKVELAYTIKSRKLKKALGINTWKLYVIGNDLFTISKFDSRFDPVPLSIRTYPLMKYWNLGLKVNF